MPCSYITCHRDYPVTTLVSVKVALINVVTSNTTEKVSSSSEETCGLLTCDGKKGGGRGPRLLVRLRQCTVGQGLSAGHLTCCFTCHALIACPQFIFSQQSG